MTDTCKFCVHKRMVPNPQTKSLEVVCTRYPPQLYMFPTQNGLAGMVKYPNISDDFISCGDFEHPELVNTDPPFDS